MAKPKRTSGSKNPENGEKKQRKSKVSGVHGKSKKPFKRLPKKKLSKKPKVAKDEKTPPTEKHVKAGGVKRLRPQDKEEAIKKKQKRSAPPLERKERRMLRKSQRPHSQLAGESKTLWERLRRHDLKPADRTVVMETLMKLLAGRMYELSVKHDTARVVQSCLKNGSRQQRTVIFNELREHIVELSKLKYAKFTVKALFKYCTPVERGHVIASLYGNVRRLIRHTEAAEIVEVAYNDYANAVQRAALVEEFYGPTFALFKSDGSTPPQPLTLILAENSDSRQSILKHLKESLLPLCNKSVIKHSIVHRALLDYLLSCDQSDRAEMIEHLREVVVNILHTKEGSKVTLNCLWHGTAKDRKLLVKSFKTYVRKICVEENGHVTMLGVFDCIDDTVLVRKALLSEVVSSLEEICNDQYGRHVVLYLLSPRSPRHFSPQFVDLLTPGDGNTHSKKSMAVRWKELLEGVASPLVTLATQQAVQWCRSKPHAPLLLQIVETLEGQVDLCPLYDVVIEETCQEFSEGHLVGDPCGHWVLRRLVEAPKNKEVVGSKLKSVFAEQLLPRLTQEHLQAWVGTNRGAFVVSSVLESGVDGVKGQLSSMLKPVMSELRKGELKGQQALLNGLTKTATT